jgi:hypothetical protein
MQKNKQEKYNEISIEEFENDKQDFHTEFLKKFGENKKSIEKSIEDEFGEEITKNDYTKWL